MSQENVEIVRSIYEDWGRGDYSHIEWHDPHIAFIMVDGPNPGRWTGATGLSEGWGEFLGAWMDFRPVFDEVRQLDDGRVLVLFHFEGRGKASGVELGQIGSAAAGIFEIRDGLVTRIEWYFDASAALEAMGLSE
jgi:ketosteroid isomerase-like protein